MNQKKRYGGIEAGGTKFICAVGYSPDNIIDQIIIPTSSPIETLNQVVTFFKSQSPIDSIGIGCFGPLDLTKNSATYGSITNTPKLNWTNTAVVKILADALQVPIAIDTDVNCAALGEQRYGAGKGLASMAYMTVGTGIGVGCISNGRILKGISHAEMGHMLVPNNPGNSVSACPYHASCLEGIASGEALRMRWGSSAENVLSGEAWEQEAKNLAYGIVNIICCLMPERIIIGGGVMNHDHLIDAIRSQVLRSLNGYLRLPEITDNVTDFIVPPKLGSLSGVTGALALVC